LLRRTLRQVEIFLEQALEKALGQPEVGLHFLALDRDAIARVVQLVAQPVIPLNVMEPNALKPIASVPLEKVQQVGEGLGAGLELLPGRAISVARAFR
jgi:hypothetical protein